MPSGPEQVEFDLAAPEAIVEQMAVVVARGAGWITLLPGVDEADVPPPRVGLFSLFSGPSFHVPEATWMPPVKPGRPVEIGIRHAHGPAAKRHLAERGHPVPDTWRVVQDHPRRGLVVQVPVDAPHDEVLDWLLSAAILLTRVPLLETWLAQIHRA